MKDALASSETAGFERFRTARKGSKGTRHDPLRIGPKGGTLPTLVRLLTALGVIAAILYAAMAGLIHLVEPRQSTMTIDVPLERLRPEPAPVRRAPDIPD